MEGTLEFHTLVSRALEGNPLGDPSCRELLAYLPPGYAKGSAHYPAVYFLHGFAGTVRGWVNTSPFSPTVPERIDALITSRALPPFIGIFVDGWTTLGGAQWMNSEATGRYRDYVAQDVVAFADRTFRTLARAEGRAIVGKSSGGYGALVMARHHPDVFGHMGCHSGDAYFEYCYLPDFSRAASAFLKFPDHAAWFADFVRRGRETKMRGDDHPVINALAMAAAYSPNLKYPLRIELPFERETGRLREDVWARWLQSDPVRFIPGEIGSFRRLKSAFVDCGTKDEFQLRWGARMVAEVLRAGGVEVVHEEFEDGHMGINYRYDRSLSYLVPRMARG